MSARSSPFRVYAAMKPERWPALELEHYPGMAEAEIARIATEAMRALAADRAYRHSPLRPIKPGENIVLVITASAHRHAAFEAADFLMDYPEIASPLLEERTPYRRYCRQLGRCKGSGRSRRPSLETFLISPLGSHGTTVIT